MAKAGFSPIVCNHRAEAAVQKSLLSIYYQRAEARCKKEHCKTKSQRRKPQSAGLRITALNSMQKPKCIRTSLYYQLGFCPKFGF